MSHLLLELMVGVVDDMDLRLILLTPSHGSLFVHIFLNLRGNYITVIIDHITPMLDLIRYFSHAHTSLSHVWERYFQIRKSILSLRLKMIPSLSLPSHRILQYALFLVG